MTERLRYAGVPQRGIIFATFRRSRRAVKMEMKGRANRPANDAMSDLLSEFEGRLTGRYGEFVPPTALWKELGFATPASFRKALSQARVEVEVFDISGRRGSFARTLDVARWQATVYENRRRNREGDPHVHTKAP